MTNIPVTEESLEEIPIPGFKMKPIDQKRIKVLKKGHSNSKVR
jgi:hypothetical protein